MNITNPPQNCDMRLKILMSDSGEDLEKEGRGVPYGLRCGAAELVNIDVLLSSAVFGGIRNTFR